jgi:hypothetical protein
MWATAARHTKQAMLYCNVYCSDGMRHQAGFGTMHALNVLNLYRGYPIILARVASAFPTCPTARLMIRIRADGEVLLIRKEIALAGRQLCNTWNTERVQSPAWFCNHTQSAI